MGRERRRDALEVLVDDERFVVVAKPAGLLSVPPRSDPNGACVLSELHDLWRRDDPDAPRPVQVHRLDRETSGCMVVARDRETARFLMDAFRKRRVQKSYVALVVGAPQPPDGEIQFRIKPDKRRPGSMYTVEKGGKPCHSTYETVETFRGLTFVRVRPTTGRTHEVRVGLRHLGTPCAIDPLYGSSDPILLSSWKRAYRKGRGREELPLISRVPLHAESLAFPRPGTATSAGEGEAQDREADAGSTGDGSADEVPETDLVRVEAPLPRDLENTLRQLRRHAAPGTL